MGDQAIQDAYPQNTPNAADNSSNGTGQQQVTPGVNQARRLFPYPDSDRRLTNYNYFMRLLMGEHYEAFNVKINDERYTREYSKLRYIMVNFAGLVSKVVADMLFSEPIKLKSPSGDANEQAWLDALVFENQLNIQNYESALDNSAAGDGVYKIRIGPRVEGVGESTVIIEDITPTIYFPQIDGFNVRAEPKVKELAWTFEKDGNKFLRKEIHTPGEIRNEVWSMQNNEIMQQQPVSILGSNIPDAQETKIEHSLVIHVPNWKTGNRYFGISDYYDLDKLFYAINNRFTKVDNILDKHSDPILAVPPGVLDEKGRIKKKDGRVMEIGEGEDGKPEYIVWDASLENAFAEIDHLVDVFYMIAEISPDVLGMGKGQADTGRALKYKILRTIAKVARKKLYYHQAIQQVIYVAAEMAAAWDVKVGGISAPKKPFIVEIEWNDGLPMDMGEQVDIEAKRKDGGNTTTVDSIMRLDSVDEDTAKKKAKEIKEENAINMPQPGLGNNNFGPGNSNNNQNSGNPGKNQNNNNNNPQK